MSKIKEKYGFGKEPYTKESLIETIIKDIQNIPVNSQIDYVWAYGKVELVIPELLRLNFNFQVLNVRDVTCKKLTIFI